ncbi:hypothetical protein BDV96DRAFT_654493 [Lophiotrema nucula]|uniref:Uncharacterized protein n=1 Tax=Lophiotrema nucula TaxID=690887 RepID=A0A6A5YKI3_9PLEO|nr:hypothetical protein BDV96DRAFT_654493 [Lophiotrema nucula]
MWGDTIEGSAETLDMWLDAIRVRRNVNRAGKDFFRLICADVLRDEGENNVRRFGVDDMETFVSWAMFSKRCPHKISEIMRSERIRFRNLEKKTDSTYFKEVALPWPLNRVMLSASNEKFGDWFKLEDWFKTDHVGGFEGGGFQYEVTAVDASVMAATLSRRLMFITSIWDGKEYMGLAPAGAEPGDGVFFL